MPSEEELLTRQMPHSTEAEQSVLGSMLIDSRCISDVVGVVRPEDFYLQANREIYETMYEMFSYSEVIDNDGRRTVRVSDADDKTEAGSDRRKNVIMRRTVSPVKTDDTEARYQEYLFQAIVPEQSLLNEGKDFLYFNVKRNDGNEGTTLYKFVPNKAEISLKAGHRLNLSLAIDAVTHEVVVLTAILEPWSKAEVDMELVPVKPKTQP